MKKVLIIARQELIVNARRPGYIIMTLAVPLIGLVAMLVAAVFGGQVGRFLETQVAPSPGVLGYVDHSGLFAAELPQYAGQFIRYEDEASAKASLVAKTIDGYFVVPAGYLQNGEVTMYSMKSAFSAMTSAQEGSLDRFLVEELLAGKVDAQTASRAGAPAKINPVSLNAQGEVAGQAGFNWVADMLLPYVFGILFVITIFSTSGFLLQGVSEEKEGRIVEMLVSSVSSTQLLAGKIVGLGALGLIQVLFWVACAGGLVTVAAVAFSLVGMFKITLSTVILSLLYYLLGYVLYATLMATAGSLGTTQRESQQIAGIFSIFAMIPWFIIGFIFDNPNAPIAIVLSYIPITSPVMMILRFGFGRVGPGEIVLSLVLLIGGIAVCLWAGAKIFRLGLLMYGKRPGLKELGQAFRQA